MSQRPWISFFLLMTLTDSFHFAIQKEQLYAECGARLKNFHSSNLLCICLSLFKTNLNKAKYNIYEKLSTVFKRRMFWGQIKLPTPVLLNIHFQLHWKPSLYCLGNLFKPFRLVITFAREVYYLEIKMKKNMTIVLFFALFPMANCPCESDGKSNKLQ